jgi:hypothetical protein
MEMRRAPGCPNCDAHDMRSRAQPFTAETSSFATRLRIGNKPIPHAGVEMSRGYDEEAKGVGHVSISLVYTIVFSPPSTPLRQGLSDLSQAPSR